MDHIPVVDIIGGFCEITHLLLPWVKIRVKTMFRCRGGVGWVISQWLISLEVSVKLLTYSSVGLGLESRLCLGLGKGRVDHIPVTDIIGGFCEITHLLLP